MEERKSTVLDTSYQKKSGHDAYSSKKSSEMGEILNKVKNDDLKTVYQVSNVKIANIRSQKKREPVLFRTIDDNKERTESHNATKNNLNDSNFAKNPLDSVITGPGGSPQHIENRKLNIESFLLDSLPTKSNDQIISSTTQPQSLQMLKKL